jgi:hypothetical protein
MSAELPRTFSLAAFYFRERVTLIFEKGELHEVSIDKASTGVLYNSAGE